MAGMFENVSAKVCVGSRPATKVSEQSVWLIRPVATRAALPGRRTITTATRPTSSRPRTTRRTRRTLASRALYPRATVPFCSKSS